MEELFHFLNSIHPLSLQCSAYLLERLQQKTFKRKEFLLKAGHVCRNIYFIRQGLVRCYYMSHESEVCSWFMKEGDVMFSIESFYQQSASYEYLQALEETEVYFISYEELQFIYKEFPEFNVAGRVVTQTYHQHWAWQLFAIRMHNAEERYRWLLDNHGELLLRVPAKYLATYLDIAEVTLSKIKSKML